MNETQSDWYAQMTRKLQVTGKSDRTQESYLRAVHQLVDHFHTGPEEISENQLEDYFLFRRNDSHWAPKTLRLSYSGIKFYYLYVLSRQWKLFSILRAQKESKLPTVLSRQEVARILGEVTMFHNYAFLSTVYACGLRLQEALNLQVGDIAATRMVLDVRAGKGRKDRSVPLPQDTLQLLRRYWATHRNPLLIFPALGRGRTQGPQSRIPMNRASVQGAFQRARKKADITKPHVSLHTLRHNAEFPIMPSCLRNSF